MSRFPCFGGMVVVMNGLPSNAAKALIAATFGG
jgi:hypothetical protein